MKNRWIKRKIIKKSVKGGPERGLLWRTSVYREWFEFAKISPLGYPDEFGDLSSFKNFEEWWKNPDYGFSLFCEPEEKGLVEEATDFSGIKNYYVYLKIFLKTDFEICMARIEEFLKIKRQGVEISEYESGARFRPSLDMKLIHVNSLERQRKAWELKQKGFKNEEIGDKLDYNPDLDAMLRAVTRDIKRANAIFESISKKTFP